MYVHIVLANSKRSIYACITHTQNHALTQTQSLSMEERLKSFVLELLYDLGLVTVETAPKIIQHINAIYQKVKTTSAPRSKGCFVS